MRPTREPARNNQQTYMVTSATSGRRALFHAEPWARLFLKTLLHYRPEAYLLHAFVLMPDHFHILLTPSGALERAVQFIKGGFSHAVKVELGSNMEVWQKGFSDHRIRDAEDLAVHLRYIHENPVRAHLVDGATDYEYSTAHGGLVLDDVPQRLKPLTVGAACGAAEAAPFQGSSTGSAQTKDAPFPIEDELVKKP